MSDKSIIPLFTPDASKVKYYTTNEVRLEEQKIVRLSGYVANTENVIGKSGKIFDIASSLFDDTKDVRLGVLQHCRSIYKIDLDSILPPDFLVGGWDEDTGSMSWVPNLRHLACQVHLSSTLLPFSCLLQAHLHPWKLW